uniref:Methyltransferase type 11 domain-containing protein n=1 Tax=Globodera rostochiensis TaxID=31243 RepID=A0A914H2M9_GLORO
MDLLPRNEKEFTDPLYWKRFFEHCDTSFEWYGSYGKLSPVLEKYMRPSDTILQIGCGNSSLAEQLHDNGFRNVHSIDTDAQVITQQKKKHYETRPSLKFEQRSAADIGLPDVSVNVVVDKGTLDALLPSAECCANAGNFTDDDTTNDDLVTSMFREIDRCLTPFGRYIVITLAQQHIVQRLFTYFGTNKFMIRVQTCDRTNADFAMPVFAIIVTKFKTALAERRPTEFVGAFADGGQPPPPEQLNTLDNVLERICAAQQMNWFRHFISRGPVDETSVKICSLDGAERYELIVVDDKELKTMCKYGAFVVPFGRENDWLFATKKGRTILRKNCELHRIVIVRLSRAQKYGTLEDIQRELNAFILDFMPKACAGQKINFLSLGSADVTEQIARGDSAISGKWTVEHVQIEQSIRRRLVFMGSSNLVQSEVEVVKNNDHWQIDWSDLSCEHHKMMLTGLELLPTPGGLMRALETPLRFALLGLGGGILAKFVHDKFKQSEIVAVELDSDVLSIAQKHFEFPIANGSDRIKVVICDAIDFVREHSEEDSPKFDVLLVDLSGTVGKHGIYCPPPQFVTDETLSLMRNCLVKNGGVLSLNLVTRDETAADMVKRTLSTIFPDVYSIKGDEDINEVLICSSTANVPAIAALRLNEGEPTKKRKTSKRQPPPPTKAKIDDAKQEPWMKECIGYLEKIKKCVHHP